MYSYFFLEFFLFVKIQKKKAESTKLKPKKTDKKIMGLFLLSKNSIRFLIPCLLASFFAIHSLESKTNPSPSPQNLKKIKKKTPSTPKAKLRTEPAYIVQTKENVLLDMGFGQGVSFQTSDQENFLNVRARFQERATETIAREKNQTREETELQTRRARLILSGNFLGKDWQYYLQLSFSNLDMEEDRPVPLRDATISYTKWENANIKIGQMKIPFNRQRLISDGLQEFVDRTAVNDELNLDRDVGILISSNNIFDWNSLGYSAGIFGGDGRNRTSDASGVLMSGKITYSPLGVFQDNGEPDLGHSRKPKLSFSLAGAFNHNTNRTLSTHGDTYEFSRFNYAHTGAEFLFQWRGFSVSGESISRKANSPFIEKTIDNNVRREYSRSVKGGFIQIGYLFKNNFGIAARYGEYRPWGKTDPKLIYSKERGIAFSYYMRKHNLKFQADYAYLDGGTVDNLGSHRIRAQVQIFL